jgi:septin family protein
MLFKSFFKRKTPQIKVGDVVTLKKTYLNEFPVVTKSTLLTVQEVQNDEAQVIFMNSTGTNISRQTIPVFALTKVG